MVLTPIFVIVWARVCTLGKYNNQKKVWQAFFTEIPGPPAPGRHEPSSGTGAFSLTMPGGIDRRLSWYYFINIRAISPKETTYAEDPEDPLPH
jgi:hypothetical protein